MFRIGGLMITLGFGGGLYGDHHRRTLDCGIPLLITVFRSLQ